MAGENEQDFWIMPTAFEAQHMPLPRVAIPGPGEVHLWYLDLGLLALELSQAFADEKLEKPISLNPGQLRFARRFYLRLLLGSYLGLAGKDVILIRSQRGKPMLDRSVHSIPLQFSMAKSDDRLLVGISSEMLVGVDLEPARRAPRSALRLAQRYFSAAEARSLQNLPDEQQDAAFLRAWACKEAVVKAYGEGIANQLCRFTVEMDPAQPPAMLDFDGLGSVDWSLAVLRPDDEYIAAIALHQASLKPRCFALTAR